MNVVQLIGYMVFMMNVKNKKQKNKFFYNYSYFKKGKRRYSVKIWK